VLEQANFWGCEGFCPKFPKLARKVYVRLLPTNFLPQKSFLGMASKKRKKVFMCCFCVFLQTLGAMFSNQTTLGAICARLFRDCAQIFRDFSRIFKDFAQIFKDFAWIFRDFSHIFDKSKVLGVRLHPPTPPPPTPLCKTVTKYCHLQFSLMPHLPT